LKTMKIKKGDLVCLRSGSPIMTVSEVYPSLNMVYCRWFEKNRSKSEEFDFDSLVVINQEVTSILALIISMTLLGIVIIQTVKHIR